MKNKKHNPFDMIILMSLYMMINEICACYNASNLDQDKIKSRVYEYPDRIKQEYLRIMKMSNEQICAYKDSSYYHAHSEECRELINVIAKSRNKLEEIVYHNND